MSVIIICGLSFKKRSEFLWREEAIKVEQMERRQEGMLEDEYQSVAL